MTFQKQIVFICLSLMLGIPILFGADPTKILIISGKDSHGKGAHEWTLGAQLLTKCLNEESGLKVEAIHSKLWPEDERIFDEVASVVVLSDGNGRHPLIQKMDQFKKVMDRGVGLVCVHFAVEMPKGPNGDLLKSWIGGYFETHWSVNPHWTAEFDQYPNHPISRGLTPFKLKDEWYYHMRFANLGKVQPILSDLPPEDSLKRKDGAHSNNPHVRKAVLERKESQHVAWAYERPDGKGRGFATTGAHFHTAWDVDAFRTMVLNGIVWTAHMDVPEKGVPSLPNPTKRQGLVLERNAAADACCEGAAAYQSPNLHRRSKSSVVNIEAMIKGAKDLYLVVDDMNNGIGSDWANWAKPELHDSKGSVTDLTTMKWTYAKSGAGEVRLHKNYSNKPISLDGKVYQKGIGTHAQSIIHYKLPEGHDFVKFTAIAGVDDEKKKQASGLQFKVMMQKPEARISVFEKVNHVPTNAFELPEGLELQIWAKSPLFNNPTNMDIDYRGRVWVAEGRNYRGQKMDPKGDRIVVVEDKNGDGKAESSHVFVQEPALIAPLGVAVVDNRVIVSQPPELICYIDVNRNSVFEPGIDKREVLLTGFGGRNHDHSLHSVTVGPNGQYYFNHGNCGSKVTDKEGWTLNAGSFYMTKDASGQASSDQNVYIGGVALRMNADGTGLRPIGHNFRNSYEQVVTSFGDVFQNDNDDPPNCRTTWLMEYANLGFASRNGKRNWGSDMMPGQTRQQAHWRQEDPGTLPAGDVYGGGSPTGIAFYENGVLEQQLKGTVLTCEPARNVVFAYKPGLKGAGMSMNERQDFLTSNPEKEFDGADFKRSNGKADEVRTLFRPSDITVGPDGAIYVADWFDSRVGGHGTRDKTTSGTIYRIVAKGTQPKTPSLDLNTTQGQLAAFQSPAPNVRELGRSRLAEAGEAVLYDVSLLLDHHNEYIRARAVWLISQLGPKGLAKVESLLEHSDPQMRIVAFRALRFANHKTLEHARTLSLDSHAGVRREVALALYHSTFESCQDILLNLAKAHDGVDRFSVEAFGLAAKQKEVKTYEMIKHAGLPEKVYRHLVWRLQPILAVDEIKAWATNPALSLEERRSMLFSLSLIESADAYEAMVAIAHQSGDHQDLAKAFVSKRVQGIWFDYKAGQSEKEYTDITTPKELAAASSLPSTSELLKLKGDAKRGKVAFAKCTMCHKHSGVGVDFGPALDGWGKTQTLEVIANAILKPSDELAHGFKATELTVKGDKKIQGYVQASGNPTVIRVFGGSDVVIPEKDILSQKELKDSLMIPADKMGLKAQEVRDLVEYLKKS